MSKIIGIIAFSLVSSYSLAQQKRPLDVEACTSWNRIDNPQISPTGRYVTYKIVPVKNRYSENSTIPTVLYDSKGKGKGKYIELGGVESITYFNADKQLFYLQTDTADNTITYIVDLPSGKKRLWKHTESLEPIGNTHFSASRIDVAEDKTKQIKEHKNLIIRDINSSDSVCIENILHHEFYNDGCNVVFVKEQGNERQIKFGPIMGPYQLLVQAKKQDLPSSFSFDHKSLIGKYDIKDSLFCRFRLADKSIDTTFCIKDINIPKNFRIVSRSVMKNPDYIMLELADVNQPRPMRKNEARKKDDSFELELWTWNENEVPTLQSEDSYERPAYDKYIYNRKTNKLVKVVPAHGEISKSFREMEDVNYLLYTDDTAYHKEKEWREKIPYDVYAVDIHTGQSKMIAKGYQDLPKWSPTGRWAMLYDPINKNWNKFDAKTGEISNVSTDIPYPVYDEKYDKPAPAPSYGIAGWTSDGKYVFVMDGYDWWKIALDGKEKTTCFTRGYGRKNQISYRILYSNIDKEIYEPNEKIYVLGIHMKDMSQAICQIDMKGNVRTLIHEQCGYRVFAFSDNHKYCLWARQNVSTFPDLYHSTSTFTDIKRVTDANPQQKQYLWGSVKIVEWKNYEGKQNRGLLYLPEGYDSKQTYPVIVQFYETHTEEKNNYIMPLLSSAMANATYAMSNGYIMFMPDVHFTIGSPGQSTYDAVVSGVNWLIDQGIAHKGKIGLQGHSWSGFQTTYLVTKTDIFDCAQIGAPITDMVTGYLGIRNGSGLPRYFMYEDTQSRMGATLWDAKEKYKAMSPIVDADKIHTPLLIFHNDNDEAVAYEQGRALYLAMRRLQRPAWMVNYKGEGHFVLKPAAQKDWTIRMIQFFDYYLKGTKEPRWMKEGIQLKDRGYDQKYDLVK